MISPTRTRARAIRSQCPHRRGVAYSPKVRAFPFKVSPEEAKVDLSNNAFMPRGFLKKISNRFPPILEPAKLVPVYFPAWLIDAEIEAKATATTSTSTESEDGYVTATFINSYLSGYLMDDLSSTSFLTKTLTIDKAVPFSAELETQFDTKSLSFKQCCITEDLRIHPSTIQANLISAYPVLIPLYLAQYTGKASGVYQKVVTAILQAHCKKGPILWGKREELFDMEDIFFHVPAPHREAFLKKNSERASWASHLLDATGLALTTPFFPRRGLPGEFANIASLTVPPGWNAVNRFENFIDWLNGFVSTGTLHKTTNLDMDDPRIRPFTDEETGAVRRFMFHGHQRAMAYALLTTNAKVSGDISSKELEDFAASADARRQEATPNWWKDWLKSNTNK